MRRLAALLVAGVLCAAPAAAPAQGTQSAGPPRLSLSPATEILHVKPGQSVTETLTLDNQTENTLNFEMSAQDVVAKNGKRVYIPAGEAANSIAATAVFSQRAGSVAPLSYKTIQVRLTVPTETTIRAVTVAFRSKSTVAHSGVVALTASLGSLITFVLSNAISVQAEPARIHPATASQNLTVAEMLVNDGAEPVVPQGVVAFVDQSGALGAKATFTSRRLLPGERGEFTAEYAGRLRPGNYRVLSTFQFEGKTLQSQAEYVAP